MLILLIGLQLFAQNHFPMIVTKEARVSQPSSSFVEPTRSLDCSTTKKVSGPKKQLTWVGNPNQKPENVLRISKDSLVIATRNLDDFHLNSVTLWLAHRTDQQLTYFELTEIHMEAFELPQVKLVNGGLIIQARTLIANPEEEYEMRKGFLNLPSPHYETLHWLSSRDGKIETQSTKCTY